MADIRINALATTAASTASDDFVAVDGSANGTRKLNAYSPTFGGNLTVSGTGTSTFSGVVGVQSTAAPFGTGVGQIYVREGATPTKRLFMGYDTTLDGGYIVSEQTGVANKSLYIQPGGGGTVMGGNLTVSGTGQSSIAGNLKVNNQNSAGDPTALGALQLFATANSATGAGGVEWKADAGGSGYGYRKLTVFDGSSAYDLYTQSRTNSASWTTRLVLKSNGNFLLGTNVDSSALLQIGTNTTTAAGGISFGTDTKLYRVGTGILYLSDGTNAMQFVSDSGGAYVSSIGSRSLILRSNSTAALTLDSSQNATFAGAITSSRPYQDISSGLSNIYVYSTDTAAQDKGGTIQLGGAYTGTTTTTFGGVRGSKESTTAGETGGQLEFFTRANGGAMTRKAYISSTGNATFTGSIAIGNTVQTAVGVASTHKVTISIGGSTYYLLATNV